MDFEIKSVPDHIINIGKVEVTLRREDLIHPEIPGNKFRKLKYNLLKAREEQHHTLLTFGGAYSNHIAATAAAGKEFGLKTIGIIRGEELKDNFWSNPTLAQAARHGMELVFVSRTDYRKKHLPEFIDTLINRFGPCYVLPEGGTNALAVRGCEEILSEADFEFNYICSAVGTGGTIAGLINSSHADQAVLGFPALLDDSLEDAISKWASKSNWRLQRGYEFNGYAKADAKLITFLNYFYAEFGVRIDPVYTGKMLFGVIDMARRGLFEDGSRILAIHTGGLQGIAGMNDVLLKKGLPTIDI